MTVDAALSMRKEQIEEGTDSVEQAQSLLLWVLDQGKPVATLSTNLNMLTLLQQ